MVNNDVIVRFENVSFEYGHNKPIMKSTSFTVRRGSKVTIMGQNGAGKSTLFGILTGMHKVEEGSVHLSPKLSIALARQVIPREELSLSVREFFQRCFKEKVYDIDPKIDAVLEVVNLHAPHDKVIRSFSGGQQARLLLASALIQDPDLLLLDEPTNNLDHAGIEHLRDFIIRYPKTCVVISHDAEFLNSFTDGVLYLDVHTKTIEQYSGNYFDVVKQISARVEKENRQNALLAKEIQANKDKANVFANKGGNMRALAKRMREKAAEMEEEKVVVRKEDRTIKPFIIPLQEGVGGEILSITGFEILKNHKHVKKQTNISLRRKNHLLLKGPNGIGKSTLLEVLANGNNADAKIADGVVVGYYRQDFSTLNFDETVFQSLQSVMPGASLRENEERLRSVAAGFLLTGDVINTKIGDLSEGQKGLVAFARLVLQRPGLLILDEPTNHINFRHLPIIAKALSDYEGAMVLVSHVPEFIAQIRIDDTLDLDK